MYQVFFAISGFSLLLALVIKLKEKKKSKIKVDNKEGFFSRIMAKRKVKQGSFKRRALMANFRNKLMNFFMRFKKKENYYEIGGGGVSEKFKYRYNKQSSGRKTKFDHLFEHKVEIDEEKKKEFLKKIEEYKKMEQEEKKKNKIIKPWGFGSVLPDRYENQNNENVNSGFGNVNSNAIWNNAEKKENNIGFFGKFGNEDKGFNQSSNVSGNVNNASLTPGNNIFSDNNNLGNKGFGNTGNVNDEKINIFGNSEKKEEKNLFGSFGSNVGQDNSGQDVDKSKLLNDKKDEDDKPIDFFKMFSK